MGLVLLGRRAECARLDHLLGEIRRGASGVLVVCGEAGIGKSTLLGYALARASGIRVLSVTGVEPEAVFSFAALGRLLAPVVEHLGAIPSGHATALCGALGWGDAPAAGDRFAVYVAAFELVSIAAEHSPMLIIVDDAQWLDPPSAEALTFVARRLRAEGIGLLVGTREVGEFVEFEVLMVGELDEAAATKLVVSRLAGAPAPGVVAAVLAGVGGNPLALVEVAAALSPDQVAGRRPVPQLLPAESVASRLFGPRLAELADSQQRTLELVAVAVGDGIPVVLAAMALLGLDRVSLERLEDKGLVILDDGRLSLCHPLLRPAALSRLSAGQRRELHRQVAGVLTAPGEKERRAWHLAEAAFGPDEDAAAALEDASSAARARSGYAAAVLGLERAAQLSPDEQAAARRFLAAADAARLAGNPDRALALLLQAQSHTTEMPLQARIAQIRGRVEVFVGRAAAARSTLQAGAAASEQTDPHLASSLLAHAATAADLAGDPTGAIELARRALDLVAAGDRATEARIRFWLGLALPKVGHLHEGLAELRKAGAIAMQGRGDMIDTDAVVSGALGMILCGDASDAHQLLDAVVQDLRAGGALGQLPLALYALALAETHEGHLARAKAAAVEAVDLTAATDNKVGRVLALACLTLIEAQRGDEQDCRAHAAETLQLRKSANLHLGQFALDGLGLLELSLGRPDRAIAWLEGEDPSPVPAGDRTVLWHPWSVDLIEAYTRIGRQLPEENREQLHQFVEHDGPPPQVARAWRALALLAGEHDFDQCFARALELHVASPVPFETARTRLCYGERLRRSGRRRDARVQLQLALDAFERIGARLWANRSRMELAAAGHHVQVSPPRPLETLTAQELRVAQVAANGATNREAAIQLFLSVKTIEMHLGRAYHKLGVRSKTQLANLLRAEQAS